MQDHLLGSVDSGVTKVAIPVFATIQLQNEHYYCEFFSHNSLADGGQVCPCHGCDERLMIYACGCEECAADQLDQGVVVGDCKVPRFQA